MALPNEEPPLHTHDIEELYINSAGAPHAFINGGQIPINVVGILPENNTSYKELGRNPDIPRTF